MLKVRKIELNQALQYYPNATLLTFNMYLSWFVMSKAYCKPEKRFGETKLTRNEKNFA